MGERSRHFVRTQKIMEQIFNELSAIAPFENVTLARDNMEQFVQTLRSGSQSGFNALRTKEDFLSIILAPVYPLAKWRNDDAVSKETKQFFKDIASRISYLNQDDLGYSY